MPEQPRPFNRASAFSDNPVGRPPTAARSFQFAGHNRDLSGPERALIASKRWQGQQAKSSSSERAAYHEAVQAFAQGGQEGTPPSFKPRSADSGASRSAARGEANAGRRLPDERGFFNPNAASNGGSGNSAKNPWS